jgi:hypothetical protein
MFRKTNIPVFLLRSQAKKRVFVKKPVDASVQDIRNLGNFADEPKAIGYK